MQSVNNMPITDELKAEIMHMNFSELVEVLHECADRLVTVKEFQELSKIPRRTIYDKISSGEIESAEVFGIKIINP